MKNTNINTNIGEIWNANIDGIDYLVTITSTKFRDLKELDECIRVVPVLREGCYSLSDLCLETDMLIEHHSGTLLLEWWNERPMQVKHLTHRVGQLDAHQLRALKFSMQNPSLPESLSAREFRDLEIGRKKAISDSVFEDLFELLAE